MYYFESMSRSQKKILGVSHFFIFFCIYYVLNLNNEYKLIYISLHQNMGRIHFNLTIFWMYNFVICFFNYHYYIYVYLVMLE